MKGVVANPATVSARQLEGSPRKRLLSVAPMMDLTDRHCRYFMRLLSRHTLLYTEMVHMNAVLLGDRERQLGFSAAEGPVSLQLGGDDPRRLGECARIAAEWGYDEIDLNVGCPSERVQNGNFGACLMAQPQLVADCIEAMREASGLPVTVKHRIGIDQLDSFESMANFVATVSAARPSRFTVHARKAWLQGLSPKENREIPPLRYEDVYRLKRHFPSLTIELNGGVQTLEQAVEHLRHVDAVMIGRAAYENPWLLSAVDHTLFRESPAAPSRREVVEGMLPYVSDQLARGVRLNRITRHMLGLFAGEPGAKAWRRHLSENAHRQGVDERLLLAALELVPAEVQERRPSPAEPVLAA